MGHSGTTRSKVRQDTIKIKARLMIRQKVKNGMWTHMDLKVKLSEVMRHRKSPF